MNTSEEIRNSGNQWQHDWEMKPVYIPTTADVGSYDLPDKSILQKNKKVVGIAIPASVSGKRNDSGVALLNATAYNSAYLVLKSDTTTEWMKIRFEALAYGINSEQRFMRIPLKDVDIANSKVIIGNATDAENSEVIEIDFFYERC